MKVFYISHFLNKTNGIKKNLLQLNLRKCLLNLTAILFVFNLNLLAQEKRRVNVTVSKFAIVDLKTIDAYSKAHPTDPNERRIADTGNDVTEQDEEDEMFI